MLAVVGIAIAGAAGALARYELDGFISQRATAFPWGTFAINISGALLLGFVFSLLTERVTLDPSIRSAITIGFLGSYTTFSTLSLETFRLIEDGAVGLAAANAIGSLGAGILAVYVGVVLARVI